MHCSLYKKIYLVELDGIALARSGTINLQPVYIKINSFCCLLWRAFPQSHSKNGVYSRFQSTVQLFYWMNSMLNKLKPFFFVKFLLFLLFNSSAAHLTNAIKLYFLLILNLFSLDYISNQDILLPTSIAIDRTASRSSGEEAGNPASIMSTPSLDSCRAMTNFSALVMVAPGDCSPSLKVVSNTRT